MSRVEARFRRLGLTEPRFRCFRRAGGGHHGAHGDGRQHRDGDGDCEGGEHPVGGGAGGGGQDLSQDELRGAHRQVRAEARQAAGAL
eukprot:5605418-Pyramimonas_sp.AAC.1